MIHMKDVRKVYESSNTLALDNVNFTVEDGEFVAIVGTSGSGKSTLLHMLGGLDRPTSGHYYIAGEDVAKFNAAERATLRNKRIGFVFQNFNLLSRTTALENVMMPAVYAHPTLSMKAMRERSVELLNLVGLSDRMDHTPAQLSGGQQQRVAIARALVNNPKVLLLDEPLGALDYQLRKNLQLELKNLQRGLGLTFIYVTHDQEEALTMSDRIVVMNKGVIEQDDNPDTIYHYPNTRFVAKFIGESNFFETESETLVIRPEKLNLCPEYEDEQAEKQHPEPSYYGTVVDVVFYGTIDKVFIRLDNSNQTVVAYQYFDDVKRWSPDERVGIWWYKKDEVKVSR